MISNRHNRRGFTLVELLVVVALLGLLVALTAGVVFRIQASQEQQATEATLNKLQSSLDQRWKAVLDSAAEDARNNKIPTEIMTYCGNDKDRARSVWTYMNLKNEFPTTRAEATTPVSINGYSLKLRTIYNTVPTGGNQEQESAAMLYIALAKTGNRGEVMSPEGTQNQEKDISFGTGTARVYTDIWGTPIVFFRMAFPDEVNRSPYVRDNETMRDPLDKTPPLGKLGTWGNLSTFWNQMRTNHIGATAGLVPTNYTNRNWIPALVSFGPNQTADSYFGGDNIVSYRLRREGQRGD